MMTDIERRSVHRRHWYHLRRMVNKRIIPTLLLIALVNVVFSLLGQKVNDVVTETCGLMLQDTTAQVALQLKSSIDYNRGQLQALAGILSGCKTKDEAQALLRTFEQENVIVAYGILLPDDRFLLADGEQDASSVWHFAEEAQKAPCLSAIHNDPSDPTRKFICQSAAIEQDGSVTGVLYGFSDLKWLADGFKDLSLMKLAELYIIDQETGDYLLCGGQRGTGNFYKDVKWLQSILLENDEPHDTTDDIKYNLTSQQSGFASFLGIQSGKTFYSYYEFLGLNEWIVLLALPDSILFQTVVQIRHVLDTMLLTEIVLFLLYLAWLMWKTYQQNAQKEQQIIRMAGMLDIQQTLFDAHKSPGKINLALEKAAQILAAERTFLISLDESSGSSVYAWPEQTLEQQKTFNQFAAQMPQTVSRLLKGQSVLLDTRVRNQRPAPEDREAMSAMGSTSLMLVPVADTRQKIIGLLGCSNLQRKWTDTEFLEGIAHNFMMALENIRSYQIIHRMGTVDALTGLQNRNSYQKALDTETDIQGCVYMDANGLHDLNNRFGHTAGDEMLKFVAGSLQQAFGVRDTYRIGGDEFIALCRQMRQEDATAKISEVRRLTQEKGYHVSVGLGWRDQTGLSAKELNALITEAEYRMYEDKRQYYESLGDVSRARNMPDSSRLKGNHPASPATGGDG